MEALYHQLRYELERFNVPKKSLETLFIGGGTPSTVVPELYEPIFALLSPYLKEDAEITTEANPNSATPSWLKGMKSLGVNRVSFGVQSFDAGKLKALNRAHSPQQALEAIQTAHELGFAHLSLDLIYNYRGDTRTLLAKDIETAFSLPVDHISAYELTIESGTIFESTPQVRQEDESLAFFVAEEIKARGFIHYEISNFGHYQSRHNKGYWELQDYIGAGAGSVGFLKHKRFYPQTDIEAYITDPFRIREESLSKSDLMTEKIFLGLRSNVGIAADILPENTLKRALELVHEGKLTEQSGRFFNPDFFIADALALYLLD
jgi:oxygen-independent coproporphyrinogen-3 oxidase